MNKQHFPETILCDRVTLKKHSLDIAGVMFSYVDKDRNRLRQFLPWVDSTKTIEDELNYIKMTHENWEKHSLYDYGIFQNETHTYMGNVGVHSIAWQHERCELGYWILGDFEGKGFMTSAVKGLEKACFELGFHRVEIRCSSLNLKSASIPRRLGYRLEGVLHQDAIEQGRHRDTLIFGKTRGNANRSELPALLGLNHVYLFVENIEQSCAWYEKTLGVSPTEKLDGFALFQLGLSELCLHPADGKSPLSTGGSVGYWRTINLNSTIKRFEKNGATVYRGPLDIGSGEAICQMKDPFGNVIGLIGSTATS